MACCGCSEETPALTKCMTSAKHRLPAQQMPRTDFSLDEMFLQKLAIMNPVATTLVYEEMVAAIFTSLVGLPPSQCTRKTKMREEYSCTKGFLHVPFGWTYVHETNQRKSFHFHCAVHAGASPALLADVADFDTSSSIQSFGLNLQSTGSSGSTRVGHCTTPAQGPSGEVVVHPKQGYLHRC